MPLYEYQCTECGEIEEAYQKFSDAPLIKCRYCSGKLHKLISSTSFHLKGKGWYVTDYQNVNKKSKTIKNTVNNTQKKNTKNDCKNKN